MTDERRERPDAEHLCVLREMLHRTRVAIASALTKDRPPLETEETALTEAIERWERLAGLWEEVMKLPARGLDDPRISRAAVLALMQETGP